MRGFALTWVQYASGGVTTLCDLLHLPHEVAGVDAESFAGLAADLVHLPHKVAGVFCADRASKSTSARHVLAIG